MQRPVRTSVLNAGSAADRSGQLPLLTAEITLKSIILVFAMLLALGQASTALAACSIKTSSPAIGPVDSFALNSAPQGVMAGAGFYCTRNWWR